MRRGTTACGEVAPAELESEVKSGVESLGQPGSKIRAKIKLKKLVSRAVVSEVRSVVNYALLINLHQLHCSLVCRLCGEVAPGTSSGDKNRFKSCIKRGQKRRQKLGQMV